MKKNTKNTLFIFVTAITAMFLLHLFLWLELFVFNRDRNGFTISQSIEKTIEEIQRYKKYSNTQVYYAELEKQIKSSGSKSNKIFCIGDSWTYGIMVSEKEKYPTQLQEYLPDYKIINLGKPGMKSRDAVKVTHQFSSYFQKGDFVVIFLGMNDFSSDFSWWLRKKYLSKKIGLFSLYPWKAALKLITIAFRYGFNEMKVKKDRFQLNIEKIIFLIREKGAQPLLLTYPLPHNTKFRIFQPNDRVNGKYSLSHKIKEIGEKLKVEIIDFEAIFQQKIDKNSYFLDMYDAHLNQKGYNIFAEYVAKDIQMLQGRSLSNNN